MGLCAMGLNDPSLVEMSEVSAAEAGTIRGGACGSTWTSGSAYCAVGTVLCGSQSELCAGESTTSLVPDGGTGEVVKAQKSVSCKVCGVTQCSAATKVEATKAANCNNP
jgi:hypothetical protein